VAVVFPPPLAKPLEFQALRKKTPQRRGKIPQTTGKILYKTGKTLRWVVELFLLLLSN
jgi:hypothetical protein